MVVCRAAQHSVPREKGSWIPRRPQSKVYECTGGRESEAGVEKQRIQQPEREGGSGVRGSVEEKGGIVLFHTVLPVTRIM